MKNYVQFAQRELSDRRWQRAEALSNLVHEFCAVKTETLSGGSAPAIC